LHQISQIGTHSSIVNSKLNFKLAQHSSTNQVTTKLLEINKKN